MKSHYSTYKAVHKYKLSELLFIIIYWIVAVRVVVVLEYFVLDPEAFSAAEPKFYQVMQNNLFASLGAGLLIGLVTGLSELYLFQKSLKRLSFAMLFVAKMAVYLVSISIIGSITLFIYYAAQYNLDLLASAERMVAILGSSNFYHLLLLGVYLSLFLNFILIVKNKIGHRNFFPIVSGKYHKPKEEDRIFLFLDLKSSTQMAEVLGHRKYSQLIQDCFNDLSSLIIRYRGIVYQFVGDEAVITWHAKREKNYLNCILLFYAYKKRLQSRSNYYIEKYGLVPEFKGAINSGKIMVAEVGGSVKSEIAYHGDVLNTTARLLELCKVYSKNLLCSEKVHDHHQDHSTVIQIEFLDEIKLRGKNKAVNVYSINETMETVELCNIETLKHGIKIRNQPPA